MILILLALRVSSFGVAKMFRGQSGLKIVQADMLILAPRENRVPERKYNCSKRKK